MTMTTAAIHRSSARALLGLVPLLVLALVSVRPVRAESTPLVLMVGDSRALQFDRMKQVATTDPTIADVMVTGWNEVVIVARNPGRTKVYVWDRSGRHDYAVVIKPALTPTELQRQLQEISPPQWNFQYKILDYKTLYVHSQVMNDEDKDAVEKLLKDLPNKEQVNLIYLIEYASPAARQAEALRRLVPAQFGIVIWDRGTLMITGQASSQAEIQQLDALAKASSTNGVQVVNLVTLGAAAANAPLAEIAAALGKPYRVWLLGNTVVVEGIAQDAAAKERVDRLLDVYAAQAKILNLVRVAEKPGLPIEDQRDLLQQAVGNDLQVRTVAGKTLVIEGNLPTDAALKGLQQILSAFAGGAPIINLVRVVAPAKRQVLVHVRILDCRKNALDRLGVTWGELQPNLDQWGNGALNPSLASTTNSWLYGLSHGELDKVFAPGGQLNLLIQNGDIKELSRPNLLVNDGEDAHLQVGGQIPIPVPQAGAAGNGTTITIEYKDYGVLLDIKPIVLDDRRLQLTVSPEVSDIDKSNAVSFSGFSIPGFVTRRETTTTDILSGDTLAIGGLLQTTVSTTINKLPILGDLPIIGALFRNKEYTEGKTELVILVTPEIVQTTAQMHGTAEGAAAAAGFEGP